MPVMRPLWEQEVIRQDIFRWISDEVAAGRSRFSIEKLWRGYAFQGQVIALRDAGQGIRAPKDFDAAISVWQEWEGNADRSYDDSVNADGSFRYRFRGDAKGDFANRKLIAAAEMGAEVVYFKQVDRKGGPSIAYAPMRVEYDPSTTFVTLRFPESIRLAVGDPVALPEVERRHSMYLAKQRLHQRPFHDMVFGAYRTAKTQYRTACAVCALAHESLLDAAHIIEDSKGERSQVVPSNGLALCKIHHAAYDGKFLGITPDRRVMINADLLAEVDGPMLEHGLKDMHGKPLMVEPERDDWLPNRDWLAERFAEFVA